MFADFTVQSASLVPDGGNDLQEIESGLVAIMAGMVASVDNRALETDEQSECGAAGALDFGWPDVKFKLIELLVEETARREVSWAGKEAGEGQSRFMLRRDPSAPAIVFIAENTLAGDLVRVSADHAGRFKGAMKVHHDMVLCGGFDDLFVPVDHVLIVPVHEIYFYAGNSPFFVQGKRLKIGVIPVH